MNFYKHHLGDFMRDTSHLSILEEGVYRRLIDQYYIRESALPADPRLLYKLARAMSKDERQAVDDVAAEFFTKIDGLLHHKRCDEEIAAYLEKQEKAQKSAEARWQKKPSDASPKPPDSQSDGNANASPNAMRTHSEGNASQKPEARSQNPEKAEAASLIRESDGAAADSKPDSQTQADTFAAELRARGVTVTAQNHTLKQWISDGITLTALLDAADIAVKRRKAKGQAGEVRAGYIDAIVRDPQFGKEKKPAERWWTTQKGIDKKARELDVKPRSTESYDELKDRLFTIIRQRERSGVPA